MKCTRAITFLFAIAAIYDAALGLIFLFMPLSIFEWLQTPPPNHAGYVQFPAALLILFAIMFVRIAIAPAANRSLIFFAIGLKLSYCAVAGGHWLINDIPAMWKPMVLIDAVFLILFLWAYYALPASAAEKNH